MSVWSRFERAVGLGPSDEPRAVAVGRPRGPPARPFVSTPGARVRIVRDGWDGEVGRILLICHRRRIPVEIVEGDNAIFVDGKALTPAQFRELRWPS